MRTTLEDLNWALQIARREFSHPLYSVISLSSTMVMDRDELCICLWTTDGTVIRALNRYLTWRELYRAKHGAQVIARTLRKMKKEITEDWVNRYETLNAYMGKLDWAY